MWKKVIMFTVIKNSLKTKISYDLPNKHQKPTNINVRQTCTLQIVNVTKIFDHLTKKYIFNIYYILLSFGGVAIQGVLHTKQHQSI